MIGNDNPDIFISHASEDKDAIARPLAVALRERGFTVWFDEYVLKLGDNLRDVIDRGLRRARFGVVILSPAFFAKEWPRRELDALWARETKQGDKVILPVIHNMSFSDVASYSPLLAGKLAVSSSRGIDFVANQIVDAMQAMPVVGDDIQTGFDSPAAATASVSGRAESARRVRRYAMALLFLVAVITALIWGISRYRTRRVPDATKSATSQQLKPFVDLTLTPSVIAPGETAELKWSTQHATSVFIMPDIGFVPLNGSRRVSERTTYIVAATTDAGLVTVRAVTLGSAGGLDNVKPLLAAVELGATHFKFKPPLLDWSSVDATQVAIVPRIGFVPGAGSMEVFPQNSTQFTIIGTNPTGEYAVASTTVQVLRWPTSENNSTSSPDTATRLPR